MKLSALICVYNGDDAFFFEEAYLSILNQKLPPDQIVLIIDGPVNKNIKKKIEEFKFKSNVKRIEFRDVWLDACVPGYRSHHQSKCPCSFAAQPARPNGGFC